MSIKNVPAGSERDRAGDGSTRLRDLLRLAADLRGVWAFVAVFLIGVIFTPRSLTTGWPIFLTRQTQADILFEYAEYGILAAGMTLVILAAGIDLSVGSVLGFVATLFSLLIIGYGWGPLPAIVATVLAGLAAGAVSGFIIARVATNGCIRNLAIINPLTAPAASPASTVTAIAGTGPQP